MKEDNTPPMNKNSLKNETKGGTPKLVTTTVRISKWRDRDTCCKPETFNSWRDCERWNIKPEIQNIIEEVKAWDSITRTPNSLDSIDLRDRTNREKFMWQTDLKATSLLISLWWKDSTDPITMPRTLSDSMIINFKKNDSRNNPQHPNLSSNPARRILPTVGASTWALGSQ